MDDRVLQLGKLGDLLETIKDVPEPQPREDWYTLFIRVDQKALNTDIPCAVIRLSDDYDPGYISIKEGQYEALCDIWLAQDVVEQARTQKPNASRKELLDALSHYLSHDAYIDFTDA